MSEQVTEIENEKLQMNYPDALLRLWRFADTEAVRYALGFVRVNFKENFIEVTDGRILVRHKADFPDRFRAMDSVLMWGPDLRRICRYCAASKVYPCIKLLKDGDDWFAQNDEVRFKIQTDDGRYPNTNVIFDSTPAKTAKFSLNMRLLKKMCLAFGDSEYEQELQFTVPLDGSPLIQLQCKKGAVVARLAAMAESMEAVSVTVSEETTKEEQV